MGGLLIVITSMVGTVLQRISGTGSAMVAAPFLSAMFGPVNGILLTNLINSTCSALLCVPVLREVNWWRCLVLSVFALAGEWVGAKMVQLMPAAWMQVLIGGVVILAMLTTWLSRRNLPELKNRWIMPLSGWLGGLLMATAGIGAPATVIYARLVRWPQAEFAATMQPLFAVMAGGAFVMKRLVGLPFDSGFLALQPVLIFLAASVVAVWVGGRLSRLVYPGTARNLAFLLAGAGAVIAFSKGFIALLS